MGALCAAALLALGGCAADRPPQPLTSWSAESVAPLNMQGDAQREPLRAGEWLAWGPGVRSGAMMARRNDDLAGPPPASIVSTSVWPGREIPRESRRIPTIYSHWGRSY